MKIEFKILQMCSGHLLCQNYPDDWHELSEEAQFDFINESIWEHMEGSDEVFMIEQIENLAYATQEFMHKFYFGMHGNLVEKANVQTNSV